MKTIEVYRFDELPEDVQHKVHEAAGYMEDPWWEENWDTWKQFVKDVFPYVIMDWCYGYRDTWVKCSNNGWADMHGEELRDYLSGILKILGDNPTGYCMDSACYGYVKKHLDEIVEKDLTARDLAKDTFGYFCEAVEADSEYYQTLEYFTDYAEANDLYYTLKGEEVTV